MVVMVGEPARANPTLPRSRFVLALVAVLTAASLVVAPAAARDDEPDRSLSQIKSVTVTARAITSFSRGIALGRRYGKLRFLGGLVLSSSEPAFGGWSDLAIDPDGQRIVMISDQGAWLTGRISYQADAPAALVETRMGPLHARSGRALTGKREADAEGMALVSGALGDGQLLISFERVHRIGRFRIGPQGIVGPTAYLPLPADANRLSRNRGLEAIAVIKSGRLAGAVVAFGERRRGRAPRTRDRQGWILRGSGASPMQVSDLGDLDISGAVGLPDGGILLLERRFRWTEGLNIRMRRIRADEIRPGATLTGEIVFEANLSHEVDNMEGVTVHRDGRGQLVVTMISDDNFNPFLQRTLLLQFVLDP